MASYYSILSPHPYSTYRNGGFEPERRYPRPPALAVIEFQPVLFFDGYRLS
ncbi:hypothetical protein BIFDEN_01828 [Bifidobacterium dentium ATCC 27678]|nr:hypothetical protein BIFDEN_01828 [Bifidobacterium dentium ATCC 27678]